MNETLSYEATGVLEAESQGNVSGDLGSETTADKTETFPRLDGEVSPLVAANADVIAPCRWMGGAEVSLSTAINNYYRLMTEENADEVLADIYEFLANRVTETEEPAEEDKPEEEESEEKEEAGKKSNSNAEAPKAQKKPNKLDTQEQSKKGSHEAKHLDPSTSRVEKTSESKSSNAVAAKAEAITSPVQEEPKQSVQGVTKTEAAPSADAPEALAPASGTSENSAPEEFPAAAFSTKSQLNETKPPPKSEVEAKQQIPAFEIPHARTAANSIAETRPAPDTLQSDAGQEIEPNALPMATEAAAEPEITDTLLINLESAAISDDTAELGGEKVELSEDEPALEAFDYQIEINSLTNFAEEEVLIDHLAEAGLESTDLYEFSDRPALETAQDSQETEEEASTSELGDEPNLSAHTESTSQEQFVQPSLTIEEIEDSLIQLSERIEAAEPEAAGQVSEILDKIIEMPAKIEAQTSESIITEVEAREELEMLFAELLDGMSIEHTPELIETLAYLTLKWHLSDEIEQLKAKAETDKTPQGTGTHEFMMEPPAGLSNLKQAMTRASVIGRSALRLATSRANYLTSQVI